jgi:hypothetical protein
MEYKGITNVFQTMGSDALKYLHARGYWHRIGNVILFENAQIL